MSGKHTKKEVSSKGNIPTCFAEIVSTEKSVPSSKKEAPQDPALTSRRRMSRGSVEQAIQTYSIPELMHDDLEERPKFRLPKIDPKTAATLPYSQLVTLFVASTYWLGFYYSKLGMLLGQEEVLKERVDAIKGLIRLPVMGDSAKRLDTVKADEIFIRENSELAKIASTRQRAYYSVKRMIAYRSMVKDLMGAHLRLLPTQESETAYDTDFDWMLPEE